MGTGLNEAQVDARVQAALSHTHGQLTALVTTAQSKQVELEALTLKVDQKTEHLNDAMTTKTKEFDAKTEELDAETK